MNRRLVRLPIAAGAIGLGLCLSGWVAAQDGAGFRDQPQHDNRAGASEPRRPAAAAEPRMPFPPLDRKHEEYLDTLLTYWENSSRQIKVYQCQLTRWHYDPVFGRFVDPETGQLLAKSIATGKIKFAAPDKGMYEVEKIYRFTPAAQEGEKSQYLPGGDEDREQWGCDGLAVFEYDYQRKRLIQRELPPDMRGKAIVDGPLPFLFGAEAEKIKQRYWVRVITPENTKNEYWLEAYPKRREDAANFKKVEVIIALEDFLPKAIQIYDVNFHPRDNPARTAFEFNKREVNPGDLVKRLELLKLFTDEFFRFKLPKGWEKVVLKFDEPLQDENVAPPAGVRATRQPASRPSAQPR